MALIGSLVLGFQVQGLQNVTKGVAQVKTSLGSLKGISGGLGDALGGLTASLAPLLTIGVIGAQLKSAFVGLDELGASADKIGVSVEALSALQFAAGQSDVEIEQLQNGLQKMQVNLINNAKAFTALGLSADALRGMDTVDAFAAVAEQIAMIPNAAEQSAAAFNIFGKSGVELLPLLKEGEAGIKAFAKAAQDKGLIVSDSDVQKVKEANDAIAAAGAAIESVFNRVAVAMAPVIEETANFFSMSIEGWNLIAKAAAESIVGNQGNNSDAMPKITLTPEQQAVRDGYDARAAEMRAGNELAQVSQGLSPEIDKLTAGWQLQADTIGMSADEVAIYKLRLQGASDEQLAGLEAWNKYRREQEQAIKDAEELSRKLQNVTDAISGAKMELATFGMDAREKELFQLRLEGATPAELAPLQKLVDELSLKESLAKMAETGKAIADSFKSPLTEYKDRISELNSLLAGGNIDQATFDAANVDAFQKLAGNIPAAQSAGAADINSVEAFSVLARARGTGARDPQEVIRQVAEQQLEIQRRTAEYSKRIADALENEAVDKI